MCDMNRIILIDVDNLIDELEELADSYVYPNCSDFAIGLHNLLRQQGVDAAIEVVRKQKSVDPVKHGKWIFTGKTYKCSNCCFKDNNAVEADLCDMQLLNFKYCPNCGAKMQPSKE